MTVTTKKLTLSEYLSYEDETDTRYELVNGELVAMAQPKGLHGAISEFLNDQFRAEIKRLGREWTSKQMAIAIQSPRGGRWDTARIPDVLVLQGEQWRDLREREAIILLDEPPPLLAVEVVSESTQRADYRAKRVEYNVLGIPEYWIVDPREGQVTVFRLVEDLYEGQKLVGGALVVSPTFPELRLTVDQILSAGE